MSLRTLIKDNEDVWDRVALSKYAHDVEADIAFLNAGGISLTNHERECLGDLSSWCGRAIHLQCSHGLDALSLWNSEPVRLSVWT